MKVASALEVLKRYHKGSQYYLKDPMGSQIIWVSISMEGRLYGIHVVHFIIHCTFHCHRSSLFNERDAIHR